MAKVVRRGVFETNSSSSHVIVVMNYGGHYNKYDTMNGYDFSPGMTGEKIVRTKDLQFDTDFKVLQSFWPKVLYAIASLCGGGSEISGDQESIERQIKEIEDIARDFVPGFQHFEFIIDEDSWWPYGYVDHQSARRLHNFLEHSDITLEEFLTDYRYAIVITDDSEIDWEDYKDDEGWNRPNTPILYEFPKDEDRIRKPWR